MTVILIGTTKTISKSSRKIPSNITGNREIKELQKTAIFGTAHLWIQLITNDDDDDDNHKYMVPLLVFRWVGFSLQR